MFKSAGKLFLYLTFCHAETTWYLVMCKHTRELRYKHICYERDIRMELNINRNRITNNTHILSQRTTYLYIFNNNIY